MRRLTKIRVITALLVIALVMERYCFLTTVYKTKHFGYVLILIVILLNSAFSGVLAYTRRVKKREIKLHAMFNIERTPQIGLCIIGFVGYFLFLFNNTIG